MGTGIRNSDNPPSDDAHAALTQLLEDAMDVCDSLQLACACDRCPEGKPGLCLDSLAATATRMSRLMLDHFHREHMLMDMLPDQPWVRAHCEEHRGEHVKFSARFNRSVVKADAGYPSIGLRALKELILEWDRSHLPEYDKKLSELMDSVSAGNGGGEHSFGQATVGAS